MTTHIHPPYIQKVTLFNGCTISYTDEGAGNDTLVFIHGLGTYSGTWQKNLASLRQHYRCIAIDLPGNGFSDTGDYPYSMDFFARSVIDFIGRMGLNHVTLVGHSMGGQIALTVALMMPMCCERLILCAPAGFEAFTVHERMMYQASLDCMSWLSGNEHSIHHLVHTGFHKLPGDAIRLQNALLSIAQEQPARHYKLMTDRCIAAMLAEPIVEKLSQVTQPVLVIFGEKDGLIPNTLLHPISTRQLAKTGVGKLRNGTLRMIPDCGHFVQWECAAKVNNAIVEWMAEVSI